jgi:iron complex transport system substrate-binding protein
MAWTGQNRNWVRTWLAVLPLVVLAAACSPRPRPADSAAAAATAGKTCHRIISFAPSITETLFALGAGNRVVGVTRFCAYPPEVTRLPKVGGYVDPNYEQILRLEPDLVLLLRENSPITEFLAAHGIRYEVVDNDSVGAIATAIERIGTLCGAPERAGRLAGDLRREMAGAPRITPAPRVLFCVGRDHPGSGSITRAYLASPKSIYNEVIVLAGGHNVMTDTGAAYPMVSGEGILRLNPDIIIEVTATAGPEGAPGAENDWRQLATVAAVKNGQLFRLTADYAYIPGPRIGLLLRDVKQIVADYARRPPAGGH